MTGAPASMGGIGAGYTYGEVSGSMMNAFNGAVSMGFLNNGMGAGAGAGTGPLNWGYFNFSDGSDYTGKAKTTGFAGKIGFVYKATPKLSIGGTYHSKTSLGNMDGNASVSFNVNADTGMASGQAPSGTYAAMTIPVSGKISVVDFEWPETIGLGFSYQVNDRLMLVSDYKRINWADVMQNFKMTFTANTSQDNPLAAGFAGSQLDATMYQNWDDQDIFMIGMAYKTTEAVTLRFGASFSDNPIPNQFMNPLFPAIVEDHYSAGIGYALDKFSDINFSLQHAPEVTQTNAQGVTTDHGQTSWQLMYSKRF
jgi:long-chain fatty acid transport protein